MEYSYLENPIVVDGVEAFDWEGAFEMYLPELPPYTLSEYSNTQGSGEDYYTSGNVYDLPYTMIPNFQTTFKPQAEARAVSQSEMLVADAVWWLNEAPRVDKAFFVLENTVGLAEVGAAKAVVFFIGGCETLGG